MIFAGKSFANITLLFTRLNVSRLAVQALQNKPQTMFANAIFEPVGKIICEHWPFLAKKTRCKALIIKDIVKGRKVNVRK